MNLDLFFIAKLFLITYLWTLIGFCIWFILNSCKIYKKLKYYELLCRNKRQEVVHSFIPVMFEVASYNKKLQMALRINKISMKDFLPLAMQILKSINLLIGVKASLALIRKLFRSSRKITNHLC